MTDDKNWWRGAVMYQIYPRSFNDTSGNGVGDLKGITEKLDYIASLGVDGIWISPFLKSPQKDYGYDISDYYAIDPLFGTLDDFKELLDEAHKRDLKLIMDMVLSHTSDQHPWFQESKQDQNNPKSDWYVWADPKPDGGPPNNWLSLFGGPAWRFHPGRGQYYLHNFLKEQPDLNYHNPDVIDAVLDACKYWLDFGIDGFRLDVINFCTHDKSLRDNPPRLDNGSSTQVEFLEAYNMQMHVYDKTQPENLEFLERLRALMDQYNAIMSVAEIGDDDALKTSADYTAGDKRLHTAYSFDFLKKPGHMPPAKYFKKVILEQLEYEDAWPSWAFSNHDVIRAPSRWSGTDYDHNPDLSKLLPVLLCSLRGTVFVYQGDELGLPEVNIPFDQLQDPYGIYLWPKWQGRDGCRTPMPWKNSKMAGFTDAQETWLPIAESHLDLCAEKQDKDKNSTLNETRKFLQWRKSHECFKNGSIEFLDCAEPILVFRRILDHEQILCVFNLSREEQVFEHELLSKTDFTSQGVKINGQELILPAYGYAFIAL